MPTLASGLRISSISSQLGPVETIPQTHRGPHGLSMIRSAADLGRVPKKTRRGRGKAAASVQRIVSRTGFRGPGLGASVDSGGRRFGLRNPERSTGSRCAYASRHPRYPGVIPGYPGYKTFDRAQGGDHFGIPLYPGISRHIPDPFFCSRGSRAAGTPKCCTNRHDNVSGRCDGSSRLPSCKRFASVHGAVQNLFRVGRHLLRAAHHRLLRTRAFVEWEVVTCAC